MTKLTLEQGIILTGFTGIAMVPFHYFHGDVEKRLGRPVFTHEFASKDLMAEIAEMYREDFYAISPKEWNE